MRSLPSESVDLIYLDPPFGSNRIYSIARGDNPGRILFSDLWDGIGEYVDWMIKRIVECRRLLRSSGSVFLQCDPHSSHYLKVVLDRVFGSSNFRNEIIWKRQSSHNDSKQGAKHYGKIHDIVLFYSRTKNPKWNPQYRPYVEEYRTKAYRFVEPKTHRLYALGDLRGPGGPDKGCPRFKFLGVTEFWRYSHATMEELFRQGRIVQNSPGTLPRLKRYLDEMKGVELQDIWDDITPVGNGERSGYPTQKPRRLVERIIRSTTDIGDTVLDPFCGSGTTAIACHDLRRKWILIDSSANACRIAHKRLASAGIGANWVPYQSNARK